ncbi:hypothetical protein AB0P40_38500, partial [Streptomyces sp. NPDC079189]|uniref:hypothetical protein n=1 Tax=Streptomyces sp. NPDC079189 TaxID=3154514 RepID=UPI003423278D
GGTSYYDATSLETGEWDDSIEPGQTRFYRPDTGTDRWHEDGSKGGGPVAPGPDRAGPGARPAFF